MEVKNRYEDHNKKTREYMDILCQSIENEYGTIDGPYILSLDLIADNYDILIEAQEDIKKNGLRQTDERGRASKNDSIQIYNTAQQNIMRLLNNFGKTPMSKSKIKHLDTDVSDAADEIFND